MHVCVHTIQQDLCIYGVCADSCDDMACRICNSKYVRTHKRKHMQHTKAQLGQLFHTESDIPIYLQFCCNVSLIWPFDSRCPSRSRLWDKLSAKLSTFASPTRSWIERCQRRPKSESVLKNKWFIDPERWSPFANPRKSGFGKFCAMNLNPPEKKRLFGSDTHVCLASGLRACVTAWPRGLHGCDLFVILG